MSSPPPDTDTAIVLGMASTALPFARSPEGEAERWLRILRLHGQAGSALQALGVSETPIHDAPPPAAEEASAPAPGHRDPVAAVTVRAGDVAAARGAARVQTSDVLVAVMQLYGECFDSLLRRHGTDRAEVLARLGAHAATVG